MVFVLTYKIVIQPHHWLNFKCSYEIHTRILTKAHHENDNDFAEKTNYNCNWKSFNIKNVISITHHIFFLEQHVPWLDGRIVGGEDVLIQDYPHQASLRFNTQHICGGAIISVNWVLSAAHCIIA